MSKTSSLKFVRNVSARGSTTKYANAMPPANRSVAAAAKTDTIRCVLLLHGGREEGPELVEEDRQRDRDRGGEADLHGGRERLEDAERDDLLVVGQRLA